jgi:transposase
VGRLSPLLPPQRLRTGRPARDHRTVLSAILWAASATSLDTWTRCSVGGKGCSYPAVRRLLARRHVVAVIPYRRDQRPEDGRHRPFDRETYRSRNRIERLVNRMKAFRRVATRYEKRAAHYLAMLTLTAVVLWL